MEDGMEVGKRFGKEVAFWNKGKPQVVGDYLNRPAALRLLGEVCGKRVLDAGCGTGYMTRMLAEKEARAYGVDISRTLIETAKRFEAMKPLGIEYQRSKMQALPYRARWFDKMLCVSSLMYCPRKTVVGFYREAWRTLKKNGILVVAVTHPSLYEWGSVALDDGKGGKWLTFIPRGKETGDDTDDYIPYRRYEQHYYDRKGNCSVQKVWNHSLVDYVNLGLEAGLVLDTMREIRFPRELACNEWGHLSGYLAYLQLRFRKP